MSIIIGADKHGTNLKNIIKSYIESLNYEVIDVSCEQEKDFVDITLDVVDELKKDSKSLGIIIDGYGVGPFMVASKIKGVIAAEVSDERSAYMTRSHNNSRVITLGSEICGHGIAKNIARSFIEGKYDGGRHQIRVDMLNKMC